MAGQADTLKNKRVLVVDDNVELTQTYQELLEMHGCLVTVASDGVLALKLITQVEVDAILCDLSMPNLEGDMFYNAAIHVRPELARRFIFITGNAGNPKFDSFLKHEHAKVLYKPAPMKEILAALEGLFRQSGGGS